MITNERQYQQTRKKLAELDELIVATETGDAGRILAAARDGNLGERRDAEFVRAHASRLRDS